MNLFGSLGRMLAVGACVALFVGSAYGESDLPDSGPQHIEDRRESADTCPDGCVLETDLIVYDLLASGSTDILMDFDIDLATELLGSLADVCGFCEVWESGTVIYDVTTGSVSLGGGWDVRLPEGWAAVHKPGQYRSADRDDPVRNFRITVLDWIQVRD